MEILLIRHGQADYTEIDAFGYPGFGRDLAPLSELGRKQAADASEDPRLNGTELLVSSSFTRALQTAAILSRQLNLELRVEPGLHEWLPDLTFSTSAVSEVHQAAEEYRSCNGVWTPECQYRWESAEQLRNRVLKVLMSYKQAGWQKIAVVTHGMVIQQLVPSERVANCEMLKLTL